MVNHPISQAPNSVAVGMVLPAASAYAVSISLTAVVNRVSLVTLHAGPAASTEYIVPVTSGHETAIAAPEIGLAQTFHVIIDGETFVIAAFERSTKLLADKRLTVAGETVVILLTVATVEPVLPAASM